MTRIGEFLRSVIPEDPFQLVFLAGVVCLLVAHGLRWLPTNLSSAGRSADALTPWLQYGGAFFVYFIIFSEIAGYFVCFWPGPYPVRRVIWYVWVPALVGFGLMFGRLLYLSLPPSSVLESTGGALARQLHLALVTSPKLPGFQFTLVGLVLIAVFASRLAFGISTLPLTLPDSRPFRSEDHETWRRLQVVIFTLIGPLFLVSVFLSFVGLIIPLIISSRLPSYTQRAWFSQMASILETLAACAVLLCLMGRENRQTVWNSIRWPDRMNVLLALMIPVGTSVVISVCQFLVDRALWAAHDFRRLSALELKSYFGMPDPRFFLLFFAAFFEEMIFRGLLQRRLIQKYGMYRGIFLVGIVWAAFHFFSDFSFMRYTGLAVPLQLSFRVLMCVTLSFVLGWLTLRSGSILPAAIAHTLYNVLAYSDPGPFFPGKKIVVVGLWAIGAYLLFRYWPVREESSLKPLADSSASEGAL